MCGIIGVFKHEGDANVEIYEGLLMLQHRGQDSGAAAARRRCASGRASTAAARRAAPCCALWLQQPAAHP
jgi:glutamine phosphoribosylpyrophosphate amidotransferase